MGGKQKISCALIEAQTASKAQMICGLWSVVLVIKLECFELEHEHEIDRNSDGTSNQTNQSHQPQNNGTPHQLEMTFRLRQVTSN